MDAAQVAGLIVGEEQQAPGVRLPLGVQFDEELPLPVGQIPGEVIRVRRMEQRHQVVEELAGLFPFLVHRFSISPGRAGGKAGGGRRQRSLARRRIRPAPISYKLRRLKAYATCRLRISMIPWRHLRSQ